MQPNLRTALATAALALAAASKPKPSAALALAAATQVCARMLWTCGRMRWLAMHHPAPPGLPFSLPTLHAAPACSSSGMPWPAPDVLFLLKSFECSNGGVGL